jgi:hypothetical protein
LLIPEADKRAPGSLFAASNQARSQVDHQRYNSDIEEERDDRMQRYEAPQLLRIDVDIGSLRGGRDRG